jgi:hypothetical protein
MEGKISREQVKRLSNLSSGLQVQIPNQVMRVRISAAQVKEKEFDHKHNCLKLILNTQVEILAPEQVTVGDKTIDLAGFKFWLMPARVEPATKDENWAFAGVAAGLEKSNFDWMRFPDGDWDPKLVSQHLTDHVMLMKVDCRPNWVTRDLTAEERARLLAGETVEHLSDDKRRVHQVITRGGEVQRVQDGFVLYSDWKSVVGGDSGAGDAGAGGVI